MAHVITPSIRRPPTLSPSIPRTAYNIPRYQTPSFQTHSLWGCSHHQKYNHDQHRTHIRFILGKHHRLRRPHISHNPPREQSIFPNHVHQSWQSPGCGWGGSKAGISEIRSTNKDRRGGKTWQQTKNEYWEPSSHHDRTQQRMDWIRKEVEKDPYTALFGRRLELFSFGLGSGFKLENRFTELCRSVLGLDRDVDAGRADEKKNKRTVDTTVSNSKRKDTTEPSSREKAQEPETQWVRCQATPDLRGAGFQFDPISGRMVPRAPESIRVTEEADRQSYAGDAVDKDYTPGSEELSSSPTIEKAETVPSTSTNAESLDYAKTAVLEVSKEPEGTSTATTASKDQPNASSPVKNAPDPLSEWLDSSPEAKRAESPQPSDESMPLLHTIRYENDVLDKTGPVQPSRSTGAEKLGSERIKTSVAQEIDPLDRSGFLSRRNKDSSTFTTPDITRAQIIIDAKDEGLDLLRASDIRAAYEPRRQSIATEIEAERSANADVRGEFLHGETATQSTTSDEESSPIASSQTIDQPADESLLRDGEPVANFEQPFPETAAAEVYRIFAYDPSTLQVAEAETSSSLQESREHLHPAEALTRLANPAKFLPCLNQMYAEGYEIVSGGGDILVFRKISKAETHTASHLTSSYYEHIYAPKEEYLEEASLSPQSGHDGFYTGNVLDHPSSMDQSDSKSSPKSKVKTILQRMFIGGAATAGTCYALGVVAEYFRTGGEDGRGFDGYTAFESERRHRE